MDRSIPSLPDEGFPIEELLTGSSIIFYICEVSENFPLRFVSPNVEEIMGYAPEEFARNEQLWLENVHPDHRDEVLRKFTDTGESPRFICEYRFRHKSGSWHWMRDEVRRVETGPEERDLLVGAAIETPSRLKAESRLREQQARLELLDLAVSTIHDMVIITKAPSERPLDSSIVYVNRAFERHTGYGREEVMGRNPSFLHGEKTSRSTLEELNEQIRKGEHARVEFINYTKSGEPYWVELDMTPFPSRRLPGSESVQYWVGVNRDITSRKRAEQKLEANEQRYRAYLELSFDAIFEITLEGIITDCNQRACEMFEYSREELVGMHTSQLTPERYRDTQPEIYSEEITTGHEAWTRTYRKKDGTEFPTEINTKIYGSEGEERLIAYVRDISDHKAYQEAIQRSLKEKEMLLSEVHHRVKNNLAIVSGLLEMQTSNAESESLARNLRESQSRIQSIAMVHEKLYQTETFSDIPMQKYIRELVTFIGDSVGSGDKKVEMQFRVEPVTLNVGQAIPCGLILNELVTNIYKHGFRGKESGRIVVGLRETGEGDILLSVSDNGVGLPEDFDPESSSSLGLTLISTLVRQLDGTLEYDSEAGSGTEFRITFAPDS